MRNIKKEFILYRSIVDTVKPRELSCSHIIVYVRYIDYKWAEKDQKYILLLPW